MLSESQQEQILFDKIYQYLWTSCETSNSPPILIPETIIIRRSVSIFWYYFDQEEKKIKKRKKENVRNETIRQNWLMKKGKSGIVAYLLHFIENLDFSGKPSSQFSEHIQIVYFDEKEFSDFMRNDRVDLPFGILQKFVEPGDDYNCKSANEYRFEAEIQVTWSRSLTLFQKRTSRKPLLQAKINVYERCCTFSGPDYMSEGSWLAQVKDFQSSRISDQIYRMINHLDNLSYGKLKILKGIFYFKVDKWARCWFLFCGNLNFENSKAVTAQQIKFQFRKSQIKIPKTIDPIMSVDNGRPLTLQKDQFCIICEEFDKRLNEVPYQYIIDDEMLNKKVVRYEEWPQVIKESATKVKQADKHQSNDGSYVNTVNQVPITLQKIHSKLNPQNYKKVLSKYEFVTKKIQVCTSCYLRLSRQQQILSQKKIKQGNSNPNTKKWADLQKPDIHYFKAKLNEIQNKKVRSLGSISKLRKKTNAQSLQSCCVTDSRIVKNPVQSYIDRKFSQLGYEKTADRSHSKMTPLFSCESPLVKSSLMKVKSACDLHSFRYESRSPNRSPYLIKKSEN